MNFQKNNGKPSPPGAWAYHGPPSQGSQTAHIKDSKGELLITEYLYGHKFVNLAWFVPKIFKMTQIEHLFQNLKKNMKKYFQGVRLVMKLKMGKNTLFK